MFVPIIQGPSSGSSPSESSAVFPGAMKTTETLLMGILTLKKKANLRWNEVADPKN